MTVDELQKDYGDWLRDYFTVYVVKPEHVEQMVDEFWRRLPRHLNNTTTRVQFFALTTSFAWWFIRRAAKRGELEVRPEDESIVIGSENEADYVRLMLAT